MRVCFFGAYDSGYPRNRILRQGLERHGHTVIEARVRERRAFRRYPALAAAFGRAGLSSDVLLVPEFRHKDVPLARLLAGRRPLVFDPLVSRVDTLVEDWGLHGAGSGQARWNSWIDRLSFACSDRVLCDTWAHGGLFASLGVPWSRLRRVPVGAEDEFFQIGEAESAESVRLIYLGGFLPLHGTGAILEALAILERRTGVPPFRAVLAGRGIEWERCRERAAGLRIRHVEFPGSIPYSEAPHLFAGADIVLGAFGSGAKAGRVVPHKVWQGLAAGRAVVSGNGEGLREWFTSGVHLDAAERGDPEDLANVLERLIADPSRRARLGAAGRARVLEMGSPDRVGAAVSRVIEELA
ncbi:MAG: glycosyltransferase family 4 protein [Candidatus Eisenbacteria bacterium]